MINGNVLESAIMRFSHMELLNFLMEEKYIHNEKMCSVCTLGMKFVPYRRNKDLYAWRCMTTGCSDYKLYVSVRYDTFFASFSIRIDVIIRIIIRYLTKQPLHSICSHFGKPKTVYRVISEFKKFIPAENFQNNKMGGPGRLIQIDETMLNFKAKAIDVGLLVTA
ncbi:hypothetical protein DMUE_5938 [Dictyocoela muelleri]|nr:hypothetical protein DMUE_5938 [Dictyocoela muelleri]